LAWRLIGSLEFMVRNCFSLSEVEYYRHDAARFGIRGALACDDDDLFIAYPVLLFYGE